MLRAQTLTEEQQTDFVLGALEGTARREVQLIKEKQQKDIDTLWKELERYGWLTPLPLIRNQLFQCQQRPGVPLFDYQLNLRELYSRWRKQEPGGEDEGDILLRDQFLLGLQEGSLKQELQRQGEARALERELRGEEGPVSQPPITALAAREPPGRIEADLEQWKEEVKRELR
ncbi:hypothetical protein SKAU_G00019480 [Synaphobranchus kaupii]|uniref:Uncharacterized protein n=1 Tax=Synaphobranchus kaupii TaxID=118154 RepID=A0A9Q1GBK8_SYNKA|nr:hypothetical protein SKAU_G00019480 [Synaphobranchus kaupii]